MIRYNIGYCENGKYGGRVIVPSYDAHGKLNFFVSRTFLDDTMSYKNPVTDKNIVGFESTISWNLPVTIVEGAFDAIAVKHNCIPVFGKTLPKAVKDALIANHVPRVNVLLDKDARKSAVSIAEELLRYDLPVAIVDTGNKKDPSSIGFDGITEMIESTPLLDFSRLITYKLAI